MTNNFASTKQRILKYLDFKGISRSDFFEETSIKRGFLDTDKLNGSVSDIFIAKIIATYIDLNVTWLLTGKGEMLLGGERRETPTRSSKALERRYEQENYKLVPMLNIDAVGGVDNDMVDVSEYTQELIPFVEARDGDMAMPISGNSMEPKFPSGTIVLIRQIERWMEYLDTGEDMIYVIALNDGRRLIKEIHLGSDKNQLKFHSLNPNVDDVEVPKSLISGIWRVLAKYQRLAL